MKQIQANRVSQAASKQLDLNNAKCTSGFKIFGKFCQDLGKFSGQIGTKVFLRGESILSLTIQFEVECGKI